MPKKGGGYGGGGAGRMQRPNLDLAGAGIAAGIGGLISYITSQAPEIGERILRNPFPSAPRIDIRSNPLERRRRSSTSMPASDRRRLSITGFPGTERSKGEGFLITPSDNQKIANDNILFFSLDAARKRKESVVGSGGTKRSGYGQIVNQQQKRHAKRVARDVGEDVPVNMPSTEEASVWLDKFMENPANQAYIDQVDAGLIDFVLGDAAKQGLFGVFGHQPGKAIKEIQAETGQNAPDHIVSGELNMLEQKMRDTGVRPQTYKEVMEWAIKNNPKYKGFTLQDMIKRMGQPTKYWE